MCLIIGGGGGGGGGRETRRFLVHSRAVFFTYKRKSPLLRSIIGHTKMKVNLTPCHYSHYIITMQK